MVLNSGKCSKRAAPMGIVKEQKESLNPSRRLQEKTQIAYGDPVRTQRQAGFGAVVANRHCRVAGPSLKAEGEVA